MTTNVQCPFCFETFEIEVFPEDGAFQEFVYDCEICCHPIEIKVTIDENDDSCHVDIEKSDGF